jgi:hypothetical protein
MHRRSVGLLAAVLAAVAMGAAPAWAQDEVTTSTDGAKAKLDDALQAKVEAGSTATVPVFVTLSGSDTAAVERLLSGDHTASRKGASIVVGRIPVQAATKVAGLPHVVSVGLVQLKQTGRPADMTDPALQPGPSRSELAATRSEHKKKEVPYSDAPKPKGSNFEKLRKLNALDAKTHNFTGAWNAGFTGGGSTVGVMDGGTDFGHPDLLNTWRTWSGATDSDTTDDGWNGWPKAFDPFGTLQILAGGDQIQQGLSWYTPTTPATCTPSRDKKTCFVQFGTRTGPSRNFDAPDGRATHTYTFPKGWSKSGEVRLGSHPDDYLLEAYEERPAFLVVDPHSKGVYDTVYVDLDDDHDFSDEKPVTKSSPASYRDMNGDGYTDLSGGLLYYISDGETALPGGPLDFGIVSDDPNATEPAGPGELLAWSGDFDPGIEGHGTLTASNVVGQAVINGMAPVFDDLPGDGTLPGMVLGGAPHAKLTPYGDIYFGFDFSTQLGYFLSAEHGVDITSNSYGSSDDDNDGYDAASQEADIIYQAAFDGRTTPIFSTGNGAPGYGTATSPAPNAGIAVGASTQFGGTGWDSIERLSQVVDNDVITFSNRGPGATGRNGVDVVADGAYSAGDATLNTVMDGRNAWETWGGTSRSTPVTVGAVALIYQAYRAAHGGTVPAGFLRNAKSILKSTTKDLGYDSFTQGAGSVDAGRAVKAAGGTAGTVSPTEWRVGDYRGTEYPVFTHVIAPGASDTQTFTIGGGGTWQVSDRLLKRTDRTTFNYTTAPVSDESKFNFNAPDYLIDLSSAVKAHPFADLMVVRAIYPHNEFDANADYKTDQDWRVLTYNWTDIDHDRRLWKDKDRDGAVDHVDNPNKVDIDGNSEIRFGPSEMDKGEYVRFGYHRPGANQLVTSVRDPRFRMDDGLFMGFQHTTHNAAIPRTHFTVEIDWYTNQDWSWLTAPATATNTVDAKVSVPAGTPSGMYEGALTLTKGDQQMVVPVDVAVAQTAPQDTAGNLTTPMQFGGSDVAAAQADLPYNNGSVFDGTDWTWRAESGDWRFFFFDVARTPAPGTQFLADTTWEDAAPFTDLDTLIMGRSANTYQLFNGSSPFGAPYILNTIGKSPNTNTGAGVWKFNTSSGGARELTAARAQAGLQSLVQHQVGWTGDKFDVPFSTKLGSATVSPSSVAQSTAADTGSFDVTFKSTVDLDGLAAEAFGLSQPSVTQEPVKQDDPDDPSTASNKKNVTLSHASKLSVRTRMPTDDVDLFVVYDANKDGQFTASEIVAASAGGTANEDVTLVRPPDGNYQIWLHGFAVAGNPSLTLTVNAIQGNDMTVTGAPAGAVPAGTPVTLHVTYNKAMTAGQSYFGELLLGPKSAPSAFTVPIQINRTP